MQFLAKMSPNTTHNTGDKQMNTTDEQLTVELWTEIMVETSERDIMGCTL